jgi:hypothetical protein
MGVDPKKVRPVCDEVDPHLVSEFTLRLICEGSLIPTARVVHDMACELRRRRSSSAPLPATPAASESR